MDENELKIPEIKLDEAQDAKGSSKLPKIKINKKFGIAALVVLIILIILVIVPGLMVYGKAKVLVADAKTIKDDFTKQDINLIEKDVAHLKSDLVSFQSSYNLLGWTKIVPFLGNYWNDGNHAIKGGLAGIDALEIGIQTSKPYADIIGFTAGGKKAANAEENANDRIQFLVSTIKDILPKVDSVSGKAKISKSEIDQIDPGRYPKTIAGKKIQENLKMLITLTDEVTDMVVNSKPLLEAAPFMLGIDSPRTYLVLFQNDKELRPTGGFITGYSIMTVDKGKVSNVSSNDIYNLDARYKPTIQAPDPVIKYLKGPYLASPNFRLRDMNFNPDFKTSMNTFVEESQKAGVPKNIDGVIAVDTQALVNLLNVLGNVGVPGYGNFNTQIIAECNCPQVIHELESFADVEGAIVWSENEPGKIVYAPPNYLNRKEIVGPLMNSVLKNALGQPKDKLPKLFEAGWNSLTQKHVLFYMLNSNAQKGVESFNIAGRIKDVPQTEDYFYTIDANLGGRKSNLYVTSEVDQQVSIGLDGSVTKTVTLTYKNPEKFDGWLNSVLPSWFRLYVPKGSQLISFDGVENKQNPYEESGKTVFAGLYTLRPEGVSKITVKYKLPFKAKGEYKILIQKQAGVDSVNQTLKVGRQEQEIILRTDQEFKVKI